MLNIIAYVISFGFSVQTFDKSETYVNPMTNGFHEYSQQTLRTNNKVNRIRII